jgi:hypothetical protein
VTSGTSSTPTSFTFAVTLYMPYVGGSVITLSFPGTHSTRYSMSITSSDPTPRNTQFSSGTPRKAAIVRLSSSCVGEG